MRFCHNILGINFMQLVYPTVTTYSRTDNYFSCEEHSFVFKIVQFNLNNVSGHGSHGGWDLTILNSLWSGPLLRKLFICLLLSAREE